MAAARAAHALAHRHQWPGRRLDARRTLHQVVVRVVVLLLLLIVVVVVVVHLVHQQVGSGQRVRGHRGHGRQSARLQLGEDFGEEARLRIDAQHAGTQSVDDQKAAVQGGEDNYRRTELIN